VIYSSSYAVVRKPGGTSPTMSLGYLLLSPVGSVCGTFSRDASKRGTPGSSGGTAFSLGTAATSSRTSPRS
jgi:hypothetical protein